LKQKLTKRVVDAAQQLDRDFVIWDAEVAGFGVRIYPSGRKAYLLKYRVGGGRGGTVRKPLIGVHGAITVDEARRVAKEWMAVVSQGGDPGADRAKMRSAPSTNELLDRYLAEHAVLHKKSSSVRADICLIQNHLRPALGAKKVRDLTRADVAALHSKLSDKPYQANRALALLSKSLNLAETWGLRPDGSNPCRHVKKFREAKRERFLSEVELARLGASLARAEKGAVKSLRSKNGDFALISSYVIAAIRLLIFTGARSSEIISLKWEYVNFTAARLELPDSKTGAKFVYLPAPAMDVLASLKRVDGNPHVIVGAKQGAHLVDLKNPWNAIRADADLNDLRIHDLRHSFASVGAMGGMSLPMIGKLLGHRETSTTARYAHLADDPVRSAAEKIGGKIAEALQGCSETANVESLAPK